MAATDQQWERGCVSAGHIPRTGTTYKIVSKHFFLVPTKDGPSRLPKSPESCSPNCQHVPIRVSYSLAPTLHWNSKGFLPLRTSSRWALLKLLPQHWRTESKGTTSKSAVVEQIHSRDPQEKRMTVVNVVTTNICTVTYGLQVMP